jgi:hypothetical protein
MFVGRHVSMPKSTFVEGQNVEIAENHFSPSDQGCQMVCFQTKKSQFWSNLECLEMENVFIFYDHLEYITAIWYNLWPFGIVFGHLV